MYILLMDNIYCVLIICQAWYFKCVLLGLTLMLCACSLDPLHVWEHWGLILKARASHSGRLTVKHATPWLCSRVLKVLFNSLFFFLKQIFWYNGNPTEKDKEKSIFWSFSGQPAFEELRQAGITRLLIHCSRVWSAQHYYGGAWKVRDEKTKLWSSRNL